MQGTQTRASATAFVPTNCADDCNVFSITLCLCSDGGSPDQNKLRTASPAARTPFWLQDLVLEFFIRRARLLLLSCGLSEAPREKLSIWYWRGKCVGWKSGREIFRQWALKRRRRAREARSHTSRQGKFKLPPGEKSRPATNKVFRFMNAHQSLPRRSSVERATFCCALTAACRLQQQRPTPLNSLNPQSSVCFSTGGPPSTKYFPSALI
jgi:hypothetical protein